MDPHSPSSQRRSDEPEVKIKQYSRRKQSELKLETRKYEGVKGGCN